MLKAGKKRRPLGLNESGRLSVDMGVDLSRPEGAVRRDGDVVSWSEQRIACPTVWRGVGLTTSIP